MDLLNKTVIHKGFGKGVVIKQDGEHFVVRFDNKESSFAFYSAFKGFLTVEDSVFMAEINKAILEHDSEIERKKQEKMAIETKLHELEKSKKTTTSKTKSKHTKGNKGMNYAFKCNYCDGGANEDRIGFSRVCSDAIIHNNIEIKHRDWCRQEACLCKKYHDGEISREKLDNSLERELICYEAYMLTKWEAFAGVNNSKGEKNGKARKLPNLRPGKLCILTTRDPKSVNEADRYIFAAFIIGACDEGDDNSSGFVRANLDYTIKFNHEESHKLKFWNFHKNANAPELKKWGSGLYRKFEDDEAMQFLDAIVNVKTGTKDEEQAIKIKDYFVERNASKRG